MRKRVDWNTPQNAVVVKYSVMAAGQVHVAISETQGKAIPSKILVERPSVLVPPSPPKKKVALRRLAVVRGRT